MPATTFIQKAPEKIITKSHLFLFLIMGSVLSAYGQNNSIWTTKLGARLFVENFSTGTGIVALPAGITTLRYCGGQPNSLADGTYAVSNKSNLFYTDFADVTDHTPADTLGRMLVCNASMGVKDIFYQKIITGLCRNAKYELSAWIINIADPKNSGCAGSLIPINVMLEVTDTAGNILGTYATGNIPEVDKPVWQRTALTITSSTTSVTIRLKNNISGGCGNVLAIDDISFAFCTPVPKLSVILPPSGSTIYTVTISDVNFPNPFFQWQKSNDGGVSWVNVGLPTQVATLNENIINTGSSNKTVLYRVVFAGTLEDIAATTGCSYTSDIIQVIVPNSGLKEFKNSSAITVYPNPCNGIVTLSCNGINLNIAQLQVFNMLGTLIFETRIVDSKNQASIDLTGVDEGMYLLKVISKESSYTTKLLLKK